MLFHSSQGAGGQTSVDDIKLDDFSPAFTVPYLTFPGEFGDIGTGFKVNDAGTKLYVSLGTKIWQFSMSSANDFSDLSVDKILDLSGTSSVGSGSNIRDFNFKSDGTQLYVLTTTNDYVTQFSLSTAYDLNSTVTYQGYASISTFTNSSPRSFTFNGDGTRAYFTQYNYNVHYLRSAALTTAWDITTITSAGYHTLYLDSGITSGTGYLGTIQWDSTGDNFFLTYHNPSSSFVQYVLQVPCDTAYDITSRNSGNKTEHVVSQWFDTSENWYLLRTQGLYFNSTGTKAWLLCTPNYRHRYGSRLQRFDLSTAFDLGSSSRSVPSDSGVLNLATGVTSNTNFYPTDITFAKDDSAGRTNDGIALYASEYYSTDVFQYDLSTSWDVSTGTKNAGFFDNFWSGALTWSVSVENRGNRFIINNMDTDRNDIMTFSFGTAYEVDTVDGNTQINYTTTAEWQWPYDPDKIFFDEEGYRAFILDRDNHKIYQYDLDSKFNIYAEMDNMTEVATYTFGNTDYKYDFCVRDNGRSFYVLTRDSSDFLFRRIDKYVLPTRWDISSAQFDSSKMIYNGNLNSIALGDLDSSFYVCDVASNNVYQFDS